MIRFTGVVRAAVLAIVFGAASHAGGQAAFPPPQIAVSPSKFEIAVGAKPTVESLRVFNLGKDPVTVTVSVATWDLDENNSVRIVQPTEQTLDQWLVINPLSFTVEAGQSQAVRFSVRPRIEPGIGEHRAMIYLTQAPREEADGPVTVQFQIGIAVYGYVGEVTHLGELNSIEIISATNPVSAAFDISSVGNAHVRLRGQYAVWPADAYPGAEKTEEIPDLALPGGSPPEPILEAGFLPTTPVLASNRRTIVLKTPSPLEQGDYVLDLNARLGDVKIDQGLRFSVEAPPPTPTPEADPPAEETPENPSG